MWVIWAVVVVSASVLASDPSTKDINEQRMATYQTKSFATEQECTGFLAKPDPEFRLAKTSLQRMLKDKEGMSLKYECHEEKK